MISVLCIKFEKRGRQRERERGREREKKTKKEVRRGSKNVIGRERE